MLKFVEKYTADDAVESDDGVVAIEYVVVAAATVAALALIWTNFGTTLAARLDAIVNSI